MKASHECLEGEIEARLWPLLETLGLGRARTIERESESEHVVFKVSTAENSLLIKCREGGASTTLPGLEAELLRHLISMGMTVPALLYADQVPMVTRIGPVYLSIYSYIEGEPLKGPEVAQEIAQRVAVEYARFRTLAESFRPTQIGPNADEMLMRKSLPSFCQRVSSQRDATILRQSWLAAASKLNWRSPMRALHGDLNPANCVIGGGDRVTFIDFADAYMGLPIIDLALTALEFSMDRFSVLQPLRAARFLGIYGSSVSLVDPGDFYYAMIVACCKATLLSAGIADSYELNENCYFGNLIRLLEEGSNHQNLFSSSSLREMDY
jgi:Ser/Thr protein kinase RdoA (MazF antagonist)